MVAHDGFIIRYVVGVRAAHAHARVMISCIPFIPSLLFRPSRQIYAFFKALCDPIFTKELAAFIRRYLNIQAGDNANVVCNLVVSLRHKDHMLGYVQKDHGTAHYQVSSSHHPVQTYRLCQAHRPIHKCMIQHASTRHHHAPPAINIVG